ncbi:MAG: 2,3-bisphosphoglycerate-independent phosphoglycerate mutase [Holosporales bacterium]|jgi:2,3-bisphosphoglycerate-independent phosphoglycerate mutase|nr:2,3-bisphosphoglycerate-independent phosphoglycerate mutase [Holosporales bacterium]
MSNKIVLCVLDGFGVNSVDNAVGDATLCATYFHQLFKTNPHTLLSASGQSVGLPDGQVGNSEVGHMTLGLGRVLKQDLCKINDAITDGTFRTKLFKHVLPHLKQKRSSAHILSLLSPGGVHSHIDHTLVIAKILAIENINVYIHAILDGRDSPPKSAKDYITTFQAQLPPQARIASVCGRFYAMDRDCRWERTEAAYQLITEMKSDMRFVSCDAIFESKYYESTSDEFVKPIVVANECKHDKNDVLIISNFRSDRIRQITQAIGHPDFTFFEREDYPRFAKIVTMTEYDSTFSNFCDSLFEKESIHNSIGQILSSHKKSQIRIAETEKYAHVTFFFNGGCEERFEGEERVFIPSPNVKTYDESPHMCAGQITDAIVSAMRKNIDVIVANYANADMLGHTGNFEATKSSIIFLDQCLQHIVDESVKNEYILLVVADHGNAEQMMNADGSIHKMHTNNFVPFVVINSHVLELRGNGTLADVAPTILRFLDIDIPNEMTGHTLVLANG